MKNNNRENYDVNNSMEYQREESEEKNKNQKPKKNKKGKKEAKSKVFNLLDEIKKEEESDYKKKLLEEVNNTMLMDNQNNAEKEKKQKEKRTEQDEEEEEQEKDEWEEKENQRKKEKERKKNKEKEKISKKEKQKEKEKEEKGEEKIFKQNKKKKKGNNIISDTFNEISNELNEQYSLEIENIFEINKKFNYPKDSPVFYLREDTSSTDLYPTPLSTKEIQNLLKNREIKPFLLKVKLIDIFSMSNYDPFSYFDFNDILSKNWSKNLEYSSLFLNEYYNYFEKNINNYLNERYQNLEIEKKTNEFSYNPIKKKKLIFEDNKKLKKKEKKVEEKNKNNDISLNFSISEIDRKGFNDISMSIIKQLEGMNLSKKKADKIASIIEEVEEDEWTEIKSKKKEPEKKPFISIVGLNESRQIKETEESSFQINNKRKRGKKNKKKNFVNFNNKFAALKVDYGSDDEEDEK